MNDTTPTVSVENISAGYGSTRVLTDISMSVLPSEIRVILGSSGCGKTTLLKAMVGLLKPKKGVVRLFGHEIREQDDPETVETLKKAGVLFQNGALLGSLTVGENIALPLEMHTGLAKDLIAEITHYKLSQVGLQGSEQLFPAELSGGMRKRAALARALVLDPPLLFCDEPSAGLDPVTAAGLDRLLLELRSRLGITIVVVTHELRSIETIADNVSFLQNGVLAFDGSLAGAKALTNGPVHDFFSRRESNRPAAAAGSKYEFTVEKTL